MFELLATDTHMPFQNVNLRPAERRDLQCIVDLCSAHAKHEAADFESEGAAQRLASLMFARPPQLYCLVIDTGQQIVGYATFATQVSTWKAARYMYLDALYIEPEFRGRGLGKELMQKIRETADSLDCQEVQWQTPETNQGAIRFYDSLPRTARRAKWRYQWSLAKPI